MPKERRAEPGEFHFLSEAGKILDERWSDQSPEEGPKSVSALGAAK